MPAVNVGVTNFEIPENAVRVLLTGYGPTFRYPQNPSWLAVVPLNNAILPLDMDDPPSPDQMEIVVDVEHPNGLPSNDPQHIHISVLQIPPTYDAAFDCVTALHARPPVLLPSNPPSVKVAPPPENGYDFILHVGLAGRGPFRIERLAHKSGYRMKDSSNQYAPVIEFLPEVNALDPSQAEILEQMRISSANLAIMGPVGPVETTIDHPVRGFGKGYESFAEDLHTTIDVENLVYSMKEQGIEIYSSMDAGHCVSDYTYYCSMAESRRASSRHEKGVQTKVLFMHCCPLGQPFATEDVTETIRKIIQWVCRGDPVRASTLHVKGSGSPPSI